MRVSEGVAKTGLVVASELRLVVEAPAAGDLGDAAAPLQAGQFPLVMFDKEDEPIFRHRHHKGEEHYLCSEGCAWIFDLEPERDAHMLTQEQMLADGMLTACACYRRDPARARL